MGLFSSILGGDNTPVTFNKEEAFFGLITSVTAIDGNISDEEVDDLIKFRMRTKLLSGLSSNQFTAIVDKVFKVLKKDGVQKLIELSCVGLPSENYNSAFAVCTDLVYADGTVEKEEEQFLDMLQSKLNIDETLAVKIVEVISLKNRI